MVFKSALPFALSLSLGFVACFAHAADKWQAPMPKGAESVENWSKLLPEMIEQGMPYGAMAGARSMLNYFGDMSSKELAYGTIISLVDLGYPFSTRADFVSGDLEVSGPGNFAQSYLLYKGIVNRDKKMEKWSEYYFNKIDKENFPKYLFFKANDAYATGKSDEAIAILKKAIGLTKGPEYQSLAKKEARTLARIYFEHEDFIKSLEIYQDFLLKLNPLEPSDWIEASWNLYKLKRYPEAMGLLYNLESRAGKATLLPEKFVLRGLIDREYCSSKATDQLIKSFDSEYGPTILGIKTGEPLSSFPILSKIDIPQVRQYHQYVVTLQNLEAEQKSIDKLSSKLRDLAKFIYSSEIAMLQRERQVYQDEALEEVAKHLVILSESLRFLKFDVAREKFNPDRIFTDEPEKQEKEKLVDSTDDLRFRLHWIQWGDYWRDERPFFTGMPKTKCTH